MTVLALDIGGTAVKSAFVDAFGRVSEYRSTPSGTQTADALIEIAADVAKTYADYDALAVSMTGQIDSARQLVLARSNGMVMERVQIPVGKMLRAAVNRPVVVLNDVNAAALGEACFGAGKNRRSFLCLTYGTGVGGAIVQNGELFTGFRGIAGEFGHMAVHAGGPRCRCGRRGCYQEFASVTALLRQARVFCPALHNAMELFDLLPHEPKLRRPVERWVREIAEGLCSLAYIFDPECFVLGGGVMERGDVAARVRRQFQKRIMPSFAEIEILQAELGNRAGMIGAAVYARRMLREE